MKRYQPQQQKSTVLQWANWLSNKTWSSIFK